MFVRYTTYVHRLTFQSIYIAGPSLFAKGYGAGLTIEQATYAIQMMPELLALYYEHSRKPSITHVIYHHQRMQNSYMVSPKLIDEALQQLNLEGCDPTDAYTFAYLHSLGVTWSQLRILTSALPLWTTVNLEPSWEIVQKGPVRSVLKRRALDYLRQRLQIGPCDIYRLVKTHTRLSMYDSQYKILPALDRLQGKLELTSAELRILVLRMPSLMGMGMSAFEDRLDFFTSEGKRCILMVLPLFSSIDVFVYLLLVVTLVHMSHSSLAASSWNVHWRFEGCNYQTTIIDAIQCQHNVASKVTILCQGAWHTRYIRWQNNQVGTGRNGTLVK